MLSGLILQQFSSYWVTFYGLCVDKFRFLLGLLLIWATLVLFWISLKYKHLNIVLHKMIIWFLFFFLFLCLFRSDLLGFYIFFEFSLIPLFILIIAWGYQSERIQAAFYLFMYTVVGSLPLIVIFTLLWGINSSLWAIITLKISFIPDNFVGFFFFFIFLGFFIKLPIYGLHLWLPKAHVEAPVSGSIILAAILLKFRLYGVYRLFPFIKIQQSLIRVVLGFLLWGGVLRSILAIRQRDMKSLVAFSSIGHMATMIRGCLLNVLRGVYGAFILIVAHGFCSSALFYLVNIFYDQNKTRQLILYRGYLRLRLRAAFWWFIFLAINFAVPPFLGLPGEIFIMGILISISYVLLSLGLIASLLAAAFRVFLFRATIHGKTRKRMFWALSPDFSSLCLVFHLVPACVIVLKINTIWF